METYQIKMRLRGSSDYKIWKSRMEMELRRHGLWRIISRPEQEQKIDAEEQLQRNDRALGIIFQSLDDQIIHHITKIEDTLELWELLNNKYNQKSTSSMMAIMDELNNLYMEEDELIENYADRYIKKVNELEESGGGMQNQETIIWGILTKLNRKLSHAGRNLRMHENLTLEKVIGNLRAEEQLLQSYNRRNKTNNYYNKNKIRNESAYTIEERTCNYCKKKGHIAKNCYKKRNDERRKNEPRRKNESANIIKEKKEYLFTMNQEKIN